MNPRYSAILIFSLVLIIALQSCKDNSTAPPQKSSRMTIVGSYNTSGYASGISLMRINNINYAFVADGSSGLQILNVALPNIPSFVANYSSGGLNTIDVTTASVNNTPYAFLSNGNQGFSIINVSTPSTPLLDTTIILNNDRVITSFIDTNGIAYLGTFYGKIYIYDVSALPGPVNQLSVYNAYDNILGIQVLNGLAYIAENTVGLEIINVSNPSQPAYVGGFDTWGNSNDVKVSGIYAYIADGSSLITLNVSNPFTPTYSSSSSTSGAAYFGVSLNSSTAPTQLYTADAEYGVETFSLVPLSSPSSIGFYNTDGIGTSVAYFGGNVYLADGSDGLIILKFQ